MILVPPTPFRRKRKKPAAATTAPPALVLVSATYLASAFAPRLTLSFDRAIDIPGLVGSAIVVTDGTIQEKVYTATGAATMLDANTVRITLVETTSIAGLSITMTATNGTGIVASDDGGIWSGVSELELPFSLSLAGRGLG